MTSSLHLEGSGFEGLENPNPKALQTVHDSCAHLHDQLSALGESLFCLLDRDVLDGTIQLLLQRFVVGLLQHLLKGAERHCDGGWQVDLLWQLASQACTANASNECCFAVSLRQLIVFVNFIDARARIMVLQTGLR